MRDSRPGSRMALADVWRYSMKSMAGQRREAAELLSGGIFDGRWIQVYV